MHDGDGKGEAVSRSDDVIRVVPNWAADFNVQVDAFS